MTLQPPSDRCLTNNLFSQLLQMQVNVLESILLLCLSQRLHHFAKVDQRSFWLTDDLVCLDKCGECVTQH